MFISVADGLWFENKGIITSIVIFILAGFGIGLLLFRKFFSSEAISELYPSRNFLHVLGDLWNSITGRI